MRAPRPYPPDEHVLRDLEVEIESRTDGTSRAWLAVTPHVRAPSGGVTAGVLATLVDIVAGNLAVRAAQPDWAATADLALTVVHPVTGPDVEAVATVARRGRTTLVVEVRIGDAGWGTATFSVLPRRADTLVIPDGPTATVRTPFGGGGSGLDTWVGDAVGLSVVDAARGEVMIELRDYVSNSFGALQGGMVAFVGEQAGAAAIGAALGAPATTVDIHIAYLAQARVGPIRTTAEVMHAGDGRGAATVRVFDVGADDRLNALLHVAAVGAAP